MGKVRLRLMRVDGNHSMVKYKLIFELSQVLVRIKRRSCQEEEEVIECFVWASLQMLPCRGEFF